MRQILFFAIAAMVLAGLMPRVMSHVGSEPAVQTAVQTRKAVGAEAAAIGRLPHRDGAR